MIKSKKNSPNQVFISKVSMMLLVKNLTQQQWIMIITTRAIIMIKRIIEKKINQSLQGLKKSTIRPKTTITDQAKTTFKVEINNNQLLLMALLYFCPLMSFIISVQLKQSPV